MTVYDWTKVSRTSLELLAFAAHELNHFNLHPTDDATEQRVGIALDRAVDHARAEALVPPLRTRAEVDAEMVQMMRERCAMESAPFAHDRDLWLRFRDLCAERLAPDPNHTDVIQAPGFDGPCFKTLADVRASTPDAPEPDRCSCEEALGLRERNGTALALFDACPSRCGTMRQMAEALRGV